MARIPEEDIVRVREGTDIVSLVSERVVLKQKGRLFWACCPFHQEKTPSFKIDPATGLWHCFGCGEGGDVFGFMMKSENLTFVEAVTTLADRAHIEIKTVEEGGAAKGVRDKVFAVCKDSAEYYHAILTRSDIVQAQQARQYLGARNYGSEVASEWMLGYSPGRGSLVSHLSKKGHAAEDMISANVAIRGDRGQLRDRFYERIMFPIFDLQGRCSAFGGRLLGEGHPKYLNTNDTPIFKKSSTMYGLNVAKNHIVSKKTALVVEGYTDVIALHGAGHKNAVATLGTALTDHHVKLLSRFAQRIVYVFDGDEAGLRAADRAVEFIDETITPEATKNPVMLDVLMLPTGSDPADMVATEAGLAEFESLLKNTKPLITFALERRLSRYDLSRPEQQVRALEDAVGVLAPIKASSIAASYARDLADMLAVAGSSIDASQVLGAVSRARVAPRRSDYALHDELLQEPAQIAPRETFDPLEVEVIGLLIANPTIRAAIKKDVSPDMFTALTLQEVYQALHEDGASKAPNTLLSELATSHPTVLPVLSGYDFASAEAASASVGHEYARNLANSHWERKIRALKAQLRKVDERAEKQRIVEEIVSLQQKIIT